jgi:ATP-independent RNA helicase DbpA
LITNTTFDILDITKENRANLQSLGYEYMTKIQEKSLPHILQKKDIVAKAQTGSGKSVAFGLGVIQNLQINKFAPQSLILCPTRELALQVANTIKSLARFIHNIKVLTLTGGLPYHPQVHSLKHKAHILVGTPGRVLKHLQEENFDPSTIDTLVLDEADRMLDMGFYEDMEKIISFLPAKRHNMFFSATYPESFLKYIDSIVSDPLFVEVENEKKLNITQEYYQIPSLEKQSLALKALNDTYKTVLIFCNTKIMCDDLADYLESFELDPLVLHSDLDQKYREETLILFANKSYSILIATDVAARGLDIPSVDLVLNFDMPKDIQTYTHRIGRTARAGKSGKVINFIDENFRSDDFESDYFANIKFEDTQKLTKSEHSIIKPEFATLYINGGKKDKLRAGDILGALTSGLQIPKENIGKIDILPKCSYVAIALPYYEKAFEGLQNNKVKNRYFKVYKR